MHEITLFSPVAIYRSSISFDMEIEDELRRMEYIRYGTNNGHHSKCCQVLKESCFSDLSNVINSHVSEYVRNVLKINDSINFEFTTSWISRHEQNDFAQIHHHKNSIFSGIVYIKTPENSGNIFFCKSNDNFPKFLNIDLRELNLINCDTWFFTPRLGDIFIFPSSLSHYSGINESKEHRYCLAFNLFPVGKLSDGIRELVIR